MEEYQNKLGNLAQKLKKERPKTPIQEVQPVKQQALKDPEVQFNNWIPKGLLKRLKTFGLEHEQSLKDLNIQALELFLKSNTKNE
ncbi:hypothetical protein BEL04_08880 [Mucilaginibacter sp. PPCGB 2223]|uniref:hypothetical protein n=1 Tax=Mucilaginibacter sp. PPCGB 2223 TaxID=1886027 RepID=UPI00082495FD|nr:hypothetical protein [Mucilaginibacter sp. PPCGB 2223]OCX54361.1 hypothetical protein BEL04_08880 [Mucilaginibacter sp. PPCGB 2223]